MKKSLIAMSREQGSTMYGLSGLPIGRRIGIKSHCTIALGIILIAMSIMEGCGGKRSVESSDGRLNFAGYKWNIKDGGPFGPGPNYFSHNSSNVWVDSAGLHLKIIERDSIWYCSEVILDHSLGYGVYTFKVASYLWAFNYNVIASGFLYERNDREIDIEFSQILAAPQNAQFVIQPYTTQGNIVRFDLPHILCSSHRIIWTQDSVHFVSWRGYGDDPDPDSIIQLWSYDGSDTPPAGNENMRFNLWLFGGQPPDNGESDEFIIRDFEFSPL
jgi:hypothetical protein